MSAAEDIVIDLSDYREGKGEAVPGDVQPQSGEPARPLHDFYDAASLAERSSLRSDPHWWGRLRAETDRYDAWASGVPTRAGDASTGDDAPFRVLTRTDLRAVPRVTWLIQGLVQTSGLIVLAGDGGVGKSAVAIDWGACVATGRDWHGRTVEAGNVLYVAGEGVEGIEDRLLAWEAVAKRQIPEERLHFVAEGFSLSKPDAVAYARQLVTERDYALVVLDTFSQLAIVESENDNAEVGRVLEQARAIRQARPGTTVLIVHHVSKGGRLRGASAIRNNADAVIVAKAAAGNTFHLTTEAAADGKQKNGPTEELDGFWLDAVTVAPGREGVVVKRGGNDPVTQSILAVVSDGQEHSSLDFQVALLAGTDAERKAIQRKLGALVRDGVLIRSGATKDARWRAAS